MTESRFLFPRWTNRAPRFVLAGAGASAAAVVFGFWYFATNKFLEVGYAPEQPVEYSHKLHAGDIGIDCRYCHATVERSSFAAVPPTQVCMNCHARVRADSPKLAPVKESMATGRPLPWVKVHNLPDYVYFDHAAHLAAGVGCSDCHGRVDHMIRVRQVQPLSMSWCIDCHRDPAPHLRPASMITDMSWTATTQAVPAATTRAALFAALPAPTPRGAVGANGRVVQPPTHCSGCHR